MAAATAAALARMSYSLARSPLRLPGSADNIIALIDFHVTHVKLEDLARTRMVDGCGCT